MYDLIIIGAGPAGITAAVYAARQKINFLLISQDIGGQTAISGEIENYTGYQFISGVELTAKFQEHMQKYAIKFKEGEEVKGLKKEDNFISIKTDKDSYQARTIIIASGKSSRQLNVPGEVEFKNRGLSYCATCDAPLFSGRDVAVIGGGNSGLEAASQLIKIAGHIYLIEAAAQLKGEAIIQEHIKDSGKVTILTNTQITAILGERLVSAIKIRTQDTERQLAVQGVFVEIGLLPNSGFAKGIDKNEQGEIRVNSANQTNLAGVFAAGDVTDVPEKQIIVAAGEGAKATLGAFKHLWFRKV